jgi:hypothetical protein
MTALILLHDPDCRDVPGSNGGMRAPNYRKITCLGTRGLKSNYGGALHMRAVFVLLALCSLQVACAYSQQRAASTEAAVATKVIAQLTEAAPTATLTASPTTTSTPPPTQTATLDYSPTPKPTRRPTSTPAPGTFANPAPIGRSITKSDEPGNRYRMVATLLEVYQGDEADALAKQELDWLSYQNPIEGQEYVAVRVNLVVVRGPTTEVVSLYSYWHFTLRYSETGNDIWSVDFTNMIQEGYPPLGGETWVFF